MESAYNHPNFPMNAPHTSSETENTAVPATSKITQAVMAALVALGIYDSYQEYVSYTTETSSIVEKIPEFGE